MNATTLSVAEEAGNATSAGNNRARSNGRDRENECGNIMSLTERGSCSKKPLCNGGR